jgi:hypothetical protein
MESCCRKIAVRRNAWTSIAAAAKKRHRPRRTAVVHIGFSDRNHNGIFELVFLSEIADDDLGCPLGDVQGRGKQTSSIPMLSAPPIRAAFAKKKPPW